MPQWLQWTLISGGLVASALLIRFIVRQSRRLKADRRSREKNETFRKERHASMVESLNVLGMAVEAEQVEYSEACLRIKGLLDHVKPELLEQPPFRVFQEVHDLLQHMPTHKARQDTETRFVEKMDKERMAIEEAHAERIREAVTALRQQNL